MRDTVKFIWNGMKVNGELYKASYSKGPYTKESGLPEGTITMYMKGYKSTPQIEGVEVINDSDVMTDYFEEDTVRIYPDSRYYEEARKACKAANIHDAKQAVKWAEKNLARKTGTVYEEFYQKELENRQKRLSDLMA